MSTNPLSPGGTPVIRVRFDATVACGRCGWPLRFGSAFWGWRPVFNNGTNGRSGGTAAVLCYECHLLRGGNPGAARVQHQTATDPP